MFYHFSLDLQILAIFLCLVQVVLQEVYLLLDGKNKLIQELLPCIAAVELCMWSAYTYNWIIDNKNINSQNPKKRLSELVAIGYLMHNDILKLDLKSETKIYIFTEWFQNIGLAYAAENYTRITDAAKTLKYPDSNFQTEFIIF